MQQSLFWFTNTLRAIEPSVNYCDGCSELATMRVRDEQQQEFFLCSAFECAEWADPAEQHDISAADWEPFVFPQPPTKAPRLEAPEQEFEAGDDEEGEGAGGARAKELRSRLSTCSRCPAAGISRASHSGFDRRTANPTSRRVQARATWPFGSTVADASNAR